MGKDGIKWTEQQRRAISARGSDVLVSASAGTGKTSVLSGRCVDIVSDRSVCDGVSNILVLTFTNAAAEQMRERIAEQLRAAFSAKKDAHLRYQLILLPGADIGTIHSFCKRLITEHFYKLGIDPTFRVIEADEQKLIKAEVLQESIDWAWEQQNLRQGLQRLLSGRGPGVNEAFLSRIEALSDFLDGVVSRQNWYERAELLSEAVNPFATELGREQKQIVAERLRCILEQIGYAQRLYEREAGGGWSEKWQEVFAGPVARCIEFLEAGDWDRCAEQIRNYQRPSRFEYKPRGLDGPVAEVIRRNAESAKKAFDGLSGLAVLNPDYLDRLGGAVGLQTKVLIELVRKFERLYGAAKEASNCLDFADLEHYALRLLRESGEGDELLPSETALALRRRYKYIFVDEYQDINPVQKSILGLLSGRGNVFVVGDVKQSIYAFRGAEPRIFAEAVGAASAEPKGVMEGLRVDLNANWRSARGILDFVNKIFGRIMTVSFADVDYDESARLRPGREVESAESSGCGAGPVVELHILDKAEMDASAGDDDDEDEVTSFAGSRHCQAVMIARRIKEMVGAETGAAEFEIYDKQQDRRRAVQYRDIVVLMRSPAKRVNDYVEVLRLADVPVSCEFGAGYFEATEISDMLSLLKVLDNPRRDIEFAAMLRSPFFKISDSELAAIKIYGRGEAVYKGFYDFAVGYSISGPDAGLAGRLKEILDKLERWRSAARGGSLADLIWRIYRQSGYLSFVLALPNGRQRRANLLKLHERAIQFEGFAGGCGRGPLKRFVEFVEKLRQAGRDWTGAEPETSVGNAVRIMSVHKSKGLEFPVVFLAELDSRFSSKDAQRDFLAGADGMLGLRIVESDSNTKSDSIAYQIIAEQRSRVYLAEEMRILYVALTRARDRLVLSGCQGKKRCRDIICDGFLSGKEVIERWQIRGCRSHLEWILYGLCGCSELHGAFETALADEAKDDDLFSLKVYGQAELEQLSRYVDMLRGTRTETRRKQRAGGARLEQEEVKLLSRLKESLAWRYGFGDVPLLPAKRSVTQLTHHGDEYARFDYSGAAGRPRAVLRADERPAESRLIGTAAHLVIARLDLSKPVGKKVIEEVKKGLLTDGSAAENVVERINTDSIMRFFEGELGQAAVDSSNTVYREWPFTFSIPAFEWDKNGRLEIAADCGESIIVQGIIDMLIRTAEGLIVIDFKTDNVIAAEVAERARLYRGQLELYGRAAEAILRTDVIGKWLYFLEAGCGFKVE